MSGAGKSTLAKNLRNVLEKSGFSVHRLDGDVIRKSQNISNSFSKVEILENNYMIIDACTKLLSKYDFILVSVISPFAETRAHALKILKDKYFEIYVKCSRDELVRRDTKGLYKKAINNEIVTLIGFSKLSPYEEPTQPRLIIQTDATSPEKSTNLIFSKLRKLNHIK